jgi:hypothetical protein
MSRCLSTGILGEWGPTARFKVLGRPTAVDRPAVNTGISKRLSDCATSAAAAKEAPVSNKQ